MTKKLWYFIFAAIIFASCGGDDDEELIGNWERVSDFDGSTRLAAVCFVINNQPYIGLGYNGNTAAGASRNSDLWVYDLAKDSWTQKADLPTDKGAKARSHASSFAIGDKGYICAGIAEEQRIPIYLNDLWEYNSTTNEWVEKKPFPAEPRSEAVGIALNGKGYVGTGVNNESQFRDFYEYDPSSNNWTMKASIMGSKRSGAICFTINGAIYVGLGVSSNSYLTDLYAYNATNDSWEKKRDLKNATDESFDDKYNMQRANGVSFVLDDKAYITLGTSGTMRLDTWEYEPVSDLWVQKTNFEGSQRTHAVAFTYYDASKSKQRAFVATGGTGSYRFEDIWEFHPNDEVNTNDNG